MMNWSVSAVVNCQVCLWSAGFFCLIGCTRAAQPPDATPPPAPPSTAEPGAPKYAVSFGPDRRFVFERVGDAWVYFDDAQSGPAQGHKVDALCDRTSTGERLSEQGIFVTVTVHEPRAQEKSGPVSVPLTVEATYDDTGHQATNKGTIVLTEDGTLICRHADNR